jgi:membrane protein YqaA with SNARE-associated domain
VALVAAIAALAWVARGPIEALARSLLSAGGLGGVFAATAVSDPFPGVGVTPILVLAVAAGVDPLALVLLASSGSMVAAAGSWCIGRAIPGEGTLARALDAARVAPILRRHRSRAVAICALSPIPYALATVGAGVVRLGFWETMRGASARLLKIAVTVAAIEAGWRLG